MRGAGVRARLIKCFRDGWQERDAYDVLRQGEIRSGSAGVRGWD